MIPAGPETSLRLNTEIDALCVHAIRALVMDAVEQARSGHPGMPMGMADAAYVLWRYVMRHNPRNPLWPNRDRLVLSAGHGSMLLYALLHLSGYDMPMEEIRRFRQWGSITPGHPEYDPHRGVETTTGPLGQGFANAVGMALAARMLAERFNRPGYPIVDHFVYVIASDGDLMEGISHEAASLAGHWGLGNLIVLYDDNEVSIDGPTDLAFTEDVAMRFRAYGWHVLDLDGHDREAVAQALAEARQVSDRPSLLICHTHLAYGSPNKQDRAEAHGAPLGAEEVRRTKERMGWPVEPPFYVPEAVYAHMRRLIEEGARWEAEWRARFEAYAAAYPDLAAEWARWWQGELPEGWEEAVPTFPPSADGMATRAASGKVLNALARVIPNLVGGSADLMESTQTYLHGFPAVARGRFEGRNIHFGVREHAMGGILNGMSLYGPFRVYGGTFLVFSDYMRPAIRLAAMMRRPVIYVFTHDSIAVGEDGPTHQPVEHLTALRAIPNLWVIRPADANEVAEAWKVALQRRDGPVALILTRQKVPVLDRSVLAPASELARGGYVLAEAGGGKPDLILIATGSEVALALAAREQLEAQGIPTRVVSMPCVELFEAQPEAYRQAVLPPGIPRLAIEAGIPWGWYRYAQAVVGLERFGASAPYPEVYQRLGFTVERVLEEALRLLGRGGAPGSG
ncbi:MAG: transketolase [Thermoflexus sp.]|jgi:transketolase|nr:transketolase [Thermoflexus sp.]MDT7883952.1 transketolase [Thermoflexus sp.]MDT7947513.1 transketolase [Thermoflexus sp.]